MQNVISQLTKQFPREYSCFIEQASRVVVVREYNTHLAFVSTKDTLKRMILPQRGAFSFKSHGDTYKKATSNSYGTSRGSFFEIWIEAETDSIAYGIADLLISAIAVVDFVPQIDLGFILHNLGFDDHSIIESPSSAVFWDDNLFSACKLVKKALASEELEFALYKYFVAQEIYPIHPMDLDPREDFFDRLYLPTIQTMIGNAVIASFSVLEELGLKENASKENPSIIQSKWNPKVYDELCVRLTKHNVDPYAKIPWLSRGEFRRPFISQIDSSEICEWSDDTFILDFNIKIVDAVFETSHIRSRKAAHGNRGKISLLSVYDIENANALARHILLKYKM